MSRTTFVLMTALSACAVAVEDNPFDVDAAPGVPPAGGDDDDAGAESSGDTADEEDDDAIPPGDDAESESTGPPGGGSSEGGDPSTTTPATDDGIPDDVPPPDGGQPVAGMYAACLDAAGCPGLDACFQTLDAMTMMPVDGFCTVLGCANAALDCDPSPGGSASATCYVTGGSSVCALDCSSGATCPAGMACTLFADASLCV